MVQEEMKQYQRWFTLPFLAKTDFLLLETFKLHLVTLSRTIETQQFHLQTFGTQQTVVQSHSPASSNLWLLCILLIHSFKKIFRQQQMMKQIFTASEAKKLEMYFNIQMVMIMKMRLVLIIWVYLTVSESIAGYTRAIAWPTPKSCGMWFIFSDRTTLIAWALAILWASWFTNPSQIIK